MQTSENYSFKWIENKFSIQTLIIWTCSINFSTDISYNAII